MTISNDATTTSITGVIPNGQNSHKKIIITLAFLVGVGVFLAAGLTIITGNKAYEQLNKPLIKTLLTGESSPSNPFASLMKKESKPLNLALLGIDRRSKAESAFRTDTMILVSIDPKANKVVLISIPRDLWVQGGRINALYIQRGWESLDNALEEITGINPDHYILTDFEDFKWVINNLGGVEVDVENTFTDTQYPIDATKGYQTVSFTKGTELMGGERSLVFSRSRKGNNGEGSDWMRMKRQHLILKAAVKSVFSPKNLFNTENIKDAFSTIVNHGIETDMDLDVAYYLWDLVKDHQKYTYISTYLDGNYVYNPPMSEYGGAWVLAPINNTYFNFREYVKTLFEETKETSGTNLQ
ncbi:hypothetical protein A3F07_01045 [candidate division WWE3 bacterium RIFCSPHIGHO2_12_FULL_38_15]|uniref:Cell envelope-related transcriptional attenuator domain-containing protein n=1 Tax=candidate division WWE3 bacterium RIFCSPHIGHO2_02_FULL_38_14 TaxID=1802620 RepID=A0A1F4VA64_UNCKA|nr:MAG: hypothetical protein A2793_03755 [candidate division WWE3 bacterium RIFCSPHIGHO2_01_FULL_38_45]OGC49161.1 MAG: hypothetical protein A3F07_01045 [candidate division WWE3 bacterium RIFCSPHIGHO2_12_FULL_38_15]OGC52573.1 MAG: hypothetical protein A3B64_03360 [candidate division WWE3 bacterium RIFCSPLOWO2_01_FULL_37_24]OGC54064.1 MAG: hypothetical protein A3D91_04885 [candidate division WWE3 bacterium RIFCSPHIGHO2_02_FULL_38_14]HLB51764.1 LCP family protein [Patescibacteria group bacterium]